MLTEVVMCTFNGVRFIEEQLDSILSQSLPVDRISIFDDGSSDGTLEIIERYAHSRTRNGSTRLAINHNPRNLGYAANFRQAISGAQADIIFLCDQDDVWENDKVARLVEAFRSTSASMVFSDGIPVHADGTPQGTRTILQSYGLSAAEVASFSTESMRHLVRRNYVNGAACAVRRADILGAAPFPAEIPHDYWLAIWCSLKEGVEGIPAPLYRYRQHGANIIGLGSAGLLYTLLGIWRQPNAPRQREMRILSAVLQCLEQRGVTPVPHLLSTKHEWLTGVVDRECSSAIRLKRILGSIIDGSYARYSSGHAWLRDSISLCGGSRRV